MTAREASSHLPPNTRPDMIVVILPAEAGPIRHSIKYWGDVHYGLATQCVVRHLLLDRYNDVIHSLNQRRETASTIEAACRPWINIATMLH